MANQEIFSSDLWMMDVPLLAWKRYSVPLISSLSTSTTLWWIIRSTDINSLTIAHFFFRNALKKTEENRSGGKKMIIKRYPKWHNLYTNQYGKCAKIYKFYLNGIIALKRRIYQRKLNFYLYLCKYSLMLIRIRRIRLVLSHFEGSTRVRFGWNYYLNKISHKWKHQKNSRIALLHILFHWTINADLLTFYKCNKIPLVTVA